MNKKLAAAISLGLVSVMCISGTIAYLTDTDTDVNTMTVGNVDIEQLEYERKVDENGNWIKNTDEKYEAYGYTPDLLQEFTQNKPIYPAVYQDGNVKWDDRNGSQAASGKESHQQSWKEIGAPGSNQLFDDSVKNVQDKFVFVKNTGKTDAYYRTIIAVECPEGVDSSLIHINRTGNSRFYWQEVGTTKIDGVNYILYNATYKEVLTPGEVSRPSLLQVFLDPEATNEDVAAFGDTFDILVTSQAVQAGFKDAYTALDTAFDPITTTNHPWSNVELVNNVNDLQTSVADGKDVTMTSDLETTSTISQTNGGIIDGGNRTLKLVNSSGDSKVLSTNGGTIKNLNIEGGFRGIYSDSLKSDITIDGVTSDATYALNINVLKNNNTSLQVKNSTLKGWVSYGNVFNSATFTNCNFGKSSTGYANFKPYMTTTLTNCNFETGFKLDAEEMVEGGKIILKNCKIDGALITSKEQLKALLHDDQLGDINKIEIQKTTTN